MTSIRLRLPSVYTSAKTTTTTDASPPTLPKLLGRWFMTLTSSPAWHNKENVTVVYTLLPTSSSTAAATPLLDDLVTYQNRGGEKLQSLRGTDTASATDPWTWTWRGNGWLRLVACRWEILGLGQEGGGWLVVFAQKTVFTPAVLNVCTRRGELAEEVKAGIEEALSEYGVEELKGLVKGLYAVPQA